MNAVLLAAMLTRRPLMTTTASMVLPSGDVTVKADQSVMVRMDTFSQFGMWSIITKI